MNLPGFSRSLVLGGTLLAGVSGIGGYLLGVRPESRLAESPASAEATAGGPTAPSPSVHVSPSPSPTISPPAPGPFNPTKSGAAPSLSSPSSAQEPASVGPAVRFVSLPSRIRSGQSFEVRWRVEGPSGALVETTTLETRTSTSTGGSNSSASSSSASKQTFGGVPAPHTFSATLTLGGSARRATLSVTATVGGKRVSAGPVSVTIE